MTIFSGTGVALITPFLSNRDLDLESLKRLVEFQCSNGTDYLVILGTTGENPVISPKEYELIVQTIIETNRGRLPLVLGMGGNNTYGLLDTLSTFPLNGIDAILSVSPYYNKPNQMGIRQHFNRIADQSSRPILLYNVPGRTGSNMTAETTLKLAEHPNIIGIKEASGNFSQCMEIIRNKPSDFVVISGDDAYTFPFITLGMDGVISVICNATPAPFSKMVRLTLEGKLSEAREIHYELLEVMNLIFEDGSPGGIKIMLEELGICPSHLRMPLHPVEEKVKNALIKATQNIQSDERYLSLIPS